MASTALAACGFLLVSTQAFLLPQPALPSTSTKLVQQQQQVSLGMDAGMIMGA